jgi:NADPH-dependent curcumin reductase CurA
MSATQLLHWKFSLSSEPRLESRKRERRSNIFDDYGSRYDEFIKQMSEWFGAGKIKYLEDVVPGLEQAPEAFMGLLEGKNFGKLIVRVSTECKLTAT